MPGSQQPPDWLRETIRPQGVYGRFTTGYSGTLGIGLVMLNRLLDVSNFETAMMLPGFPESSLTLFETGVVP